MIELQEQPDGLLRRSHGGDTLNTAVYMARLGLSVDYVTALGDDDWSEEMVRRWRVEGVGTSLVQRVPKCLPGLYIIQTDPGGERKFLYWRESAAARKLFDHLAPDALASFDLLYLSGVTLSIYDEAARQILFEALKAARARGGHVAFDTNFRPRGWPDVTVARACYSQMLTVADVVLASSEDLTLLYGDDEASALMAHKADTEIILKLDHPASRLHVNGVDHFVHAEPVDRVVDTTAAGDSFAAAYLAARLQGASPASSARAGHRLAGIVVGYAGAIIPIAAMKLGVVHSRAEQETPNDR